MVRPCVRARARLCQHKHVVFFTRCSCFYQLIYKYTPFSNDTEDQNMFLFKKNIYGAYISGNFSMTSHFFSKVMKFVHGHAVFLQSFSKLSIWICNTLYKKSLQLLLLCFNRSPSALFYKFTACLKTLLTQQLFHIRLKLLIWIKSSDNPIAHHHHQHHLVV